MLANGPASHVLSARVEERGRWLKAFAVLAALGATVGAALDGTHVRTGTLSYPTPDFLQMEWWVPLLFAGAGVAIGLARPLWERLLDRRTPRPSLGITALGMGLFIVSYVLSGLLPFAWSTVAMILAVLFAITWSACDRTSLGIFLAVSTALLGTSIEIMLVRMGLFSYTHPDLAGVVGWLPWLYCTAAVAVGILGKRLVDIDQGDARGN